MKINISLFNKIAVIKKIRRERYEYEVMDIKTEGSRYFKSGRNAHSYAKKLQKRHKKCVVIKYIPRLYDRDFSKGIVKEWDY